MKKITSILAIVLAVLLSSPMTAFAGWWGTTDIPTISLGTATENLPTIDGNIDLNEGWSAKSVFDDTTVGYFWDVYPLTTTGEFRFAADSSGLYFAMSVSEHGVGYNHDENGFQIGGPVSGNSYVFSTGEDNVDRSYGWNGDVIVLSVDPAGVLYENGENEAPWYCIGVFEDQTVKVYRENVNDGDITEFVTAAGKAGSEVNGEEGGCDVEVFIPWSIIIDDANSIAGSNIVSKSDIITEEGALTRATIIYQDRWQVSSSMVDTWGRFITVPETLPGGGKGSGGSGVSLESYAIKLNVTTGEPIPPHEHDFGDWEVVKEPGCMTKGKQVRKCKLCTEEETEYPDALGHDYVPTTVDPTCEDEGYVSYTCSRCLDTYRNNYKSPLGHAPGNWETIKEPTVEEVGIKIRKCIRCGEECERDEIPVLDPVNTFEDVPEGSWYEKAAAWCNAKGFITGTGENKFSPDIELTRGMFVQILAKVAGADLDSITYSGKFTDVKADDWFAKAVQWAADNGITGGTGETTFSPNVPVTREQLATFLLAYAKFKEYDTSAKIELDKYTDADTVSNWALEAVEWAVAEGLISGTTETTISPKTNATRAQTALIIMNFVKSH